MNICTQRICLEIHQLKKYGENNSIAKCHFMARQTRFERATPAFGGLYSIHLSYWRYEENKK